MKLQRGETTTETPQPAAPVAAPVSLPGDIPGVDHDDSVKERSKSITDQLSTVSLQFVIVFFFGFFCIPI